MVKPTPAAAFEMAEADFLFELLIVALDWPTQFRQVYQTRESDVFRKRRKPVFGRLVFAFRIAILQVSSP